MGTQYTVCHDNGKLLSCKTKQSKALSTLHTTKCMNWRDSSVTGRKPYSKTMYRWFQVSVCRELRLERTERPSTVWRWNWQKAKMKGRVKSFIAHCRSKQSYLEGVPACSLSHLCQPSTEWSAAQDSSAPTKGRGCSLTRGYATKGVFWTWESGKHFNG